MTGHWCDYENADVIMNIGSNSAENHPVSSLHINKAREKGAKWIVVDPRYTRTAELADIYCPIRSGTDIAFYGGFYKYIIENKLYQEEYVINYTNATYLLDEDYDFDPETALYSGWNKDTKKYSNHSWHYQTDHEEPWDTSSTGDYNWAVQPGVPEWDIDALTLEVPKQDATALESLDIKNIDKMDKQCVWRRFYEHYSRYDLDTVCSICGMDKEILELVYKTYGETGKPGKSGSLLYALGQTQHTYGGQNTRAMSILQLLLGNAGNPGGGLDAMRGEPNVQGATDMGMLVHEQPGYLKWSTEGWPTLASWIENNAYSAGYYTNKPKFMVSALKEWYGDYATYDNDYAYDMWPKVPTTKVDFSLTDGTKVNADGTTYTHIGSFELMKEGVIRGYICWGMNPCHSAPNAGNVRRSLAHLDWLVSVDWVETETAAFWKAPDMDPTQIATTVYHLPAALIYEKPGMILNSGRWIQYRQQAVKPYDQALPDYEICDRLYKAVKHLYEAEADLPTTANPLPITKLKWDYYIDGVMDPRPVAWALNGYNYDTTKFNTTTADVQTDLLSSYANLKADGSTACGMWIYTGFWCNNDDPLNSDAQNTSRRGTPSSEIEEDPSGIELHKYWAFCWPSNRRILYNRAASDPNGKPWNAERVANEWDEAAGAWKTDNSRLAWDTASKTWKTQIKIDGNWTDLGADSYYHAYNDMAYSGAKYTSSVEAAKKFGVTLKHYDEFDFVATKNGEAVAPNNKAFFMLWEQNARLISYGMNDGPLPEHFEPFESPVDNQLHSAQNNNPCMLFANYESTAHADPAEFPIVATTYSVTEHWQTGGQTRMCPALVEAMPDQFCEISKSLANKKGISNGDNVRVWNNRGSVVVKALVTNRIRPFTVDGKEIDQVGLTHHFGWTNDYGTGDTVNDLTPNVSGPNSYTPEYKAFLVNIERTSDEPAAWKEA